MLWISSISKWDYLSTTWYNVFVMGSLPKKELQYLYITKKYSTAHIAGLFRCSLRKVDYWLKRYFIPKRNISEAIYAKRNPKGDPFKIRLPDNMENAMLYGLGLGLYWGEGTKSNKNSIRLGNTDARLIKSFIQFLVKIYGIETKKLRFGLQIFNDVSARRALAYWRKELRATPRQFQKVVVSRVRGESSYKNKSKYGVLTIYFNNKRLRDILCTTIERLWCA